MPTNLTHQLVVNAKVLVHPTIKISTSILFMRDVFEPHGLRIVAGNAQGLVRPGLEGLFVGSCGNANLSNEQLLLYSNRSGIPNGQLIAYFVNTVEGTNALLNGCAASEPERPSVAIARMTSRWTLAHEIGHLLKLDHHPHPGNLMTGSGTFSLGDPIPQLDSDQVKQIFKSPLVTPIT